MMSTCEQFEESLWEAAQGGMVSAALEEHLRSCAVCRHALLTLSQAARGFAALRAVHTPEVRAAVWSRVKQPRWRRRPVLIGAAAMAACAVIGLLCLPRAPLPSEPSVSKKISGLRVPRVTDNATRFVSPSPSPTQSDHAVTTQQQYLPVRTIHRVRVKKDLPSPPLVIAPEASDIEPVLAATTAPSSSNTYCTRLNTFVSRTLGETLIKTYLPNEQRAG